MGEQRSSTLPTAGTNDAYKEVKRATDSLLGVPSQCLHPSKASIGMPPRGRGRGQYCGNVVSLPLCCLEASVCGGFSVVKNEKLLPHNPA